MRYERLSSQQTSTCQYQFGPNCVFGLNFRYAANEQTLIRYNYSHIQIGNVVDVEYCLIFQRKPLPPRTRIEIEIVAYKLAKINVVDCLYESLVFDICFMVFVFVFLINSKQELTYYIIR